MLKGTLEIVVGSETFTLNEGESMGFDSMIPHVLRNVGDGEFEGIWFVHGREQHVNDKTERNATGSQRTARTGQRMARTGQRATRRNRRMTRGSRRLGSRPAGGGASGAPVRR